MSDGTAIATPEIPRLREIADVLMQARSAPDYSMGSPRALDHLLTHVVAALEDIDARLAVLEASAAA